MTSVAVLTPYRERRAVDLGNRLWRTQLLPLGQIDYKGRKLNFSKSYLAGLVKGFRDRVFNQVPFQLADGDNKHNNDPERYRGSIKDLKLTTDGLDLILEATEAGDQLLRDNPQLGVSARIYEQYERSDGKFWPAALQHVLGTLDPHITGMRPWKEVAALSNVGARVLDLTEATYETSEGDGPVPLSKDKLKQLLKEMRDGGSEITDEDLDELLDEEEEGEELSDAELEAILAEAAALENGDQGGGEGDEEFEEEEEPEPAGVSAAQKRHALELASLRASHEQNLVELARVTQALDAQTYATERAALVAAGLPPKAVEMARPLLEGGVHIVDLANGDQIDAGQVMRRTLMELANTIKVLDLGGIIGRGDVPDDEKEEAAQADAERMEWVKRERGRMGL